MLCLMMGPAGFRLVPDGVLHRCALYCWDTWPANFHAWDSLLSRFRTEIAFFTSTQARDRFQKRFPSMHCYWVADGSNPELHSSGKMLKSRNIDVLELGRRYHRYHEAITNVLSASGRRHLYERTPGEVVFPQRADMVSGLADSKVVVCFPSSVTIPARSTIETITPRYFEAMASGCLIVGHCPADLRELFGYSPVVEADLSDPAAQIEKIIKNIDDYQQLVLKNLATTAEHTWTHRAEAVKAILEAENDRRGM